MSDDELPGSQDLPQKKQHGFKCPRCDSIVPTCSAPEGTMFTLACCVLTILFFNIWSVCLLPFVIALTKSIVTRCIQCGLKLNTQHPFNLVSLKDEIFTLKCGDCALVISRTYGLVAFIIASIFILYLGISETTTHRPVLALQATWPEYLKDCGGEVVLKNSVRASMAFSQKYEGNMITWDGYLMKITQNFGWFKGDHAIVLLVKMDPSESDIHADLILSLDEHTGYHAKNELKTLERGSRFRFNATFVNAGNEQQLHHLHALGIEKIEGFMDIPDHVHSVNHRYTIKQIN